MVVGPCDYCAQSENSDLGLRTQDFRLWTSDSGLSIILIPYELSLAVDHHFEGHKLQS